MIHYCNDSKCYISFFFWLQHIFSKCGVLRIHLSNSVEKTMIGMFVAIVGNFVVVGWAVYNLIWLKVLACQSVNTPLTDEGLGLLLRRLALVHIKWVVPNAPWYRCYFSNSSQSVVTPRSATHSLSEQMTEEHFPDSCPHRICIVLVPVLFVVFVWLLMCNPEPVFMCCVKCPF